MRKLVSCLLILALVAGSVLGISSCSKKKEIVALCLPSLDNPLMLLMKEKAVQEFGADYDVQVSSADGSPVTQAQQVENYTTMKAKVIFILAIETTSLAPKMIAAREKGVKIMIGGSEPGAEARDLVMKMDQYLAGQYCALMGKNWIEKTYPGAAPGSIEIGILTSSLTAEDLKRVAGIKMISEPFLKDVTGAYVNAAGAVVTADADRAPNPAFCPSVKVVATSDASVFLDGQKVTQNFLTTNPKMKMILSYSSDAGTGASKALMDAPGVGDLSKVAVFGVGMFGPEADAIKDSATGKSVFRGAVAFGGDDLPGMTMSKIKLLLGTEKFDPEQWDPLAIGTIGAGGFSVKPVPNAGVLTAVETGL